MATICLVHSVLRDHVIALFMNVDAGSVWEAILAFGLVR
jgi:hypothetical protein